MKVFHYKGVSAEGRPVSGTTRAEDEFEAVSRLREEGIVLTRISESSEKEEGQKGRTVKIRDQELALICSQLSIILGSGLPVTRCVEMVAAQTRSKKTRELLYQTAQDIAGGYTIAQSFEKNIPRLPRTFIETVRAGEQSGVLETSFTRLHHYFDKAAKTRAKIISTLTYPAIVCVAAVIVFLIIINFAVPMFSSIFKDLGTELPLITRALIWVSDVSARYGIWIILGIGLLTAGLVLLCKNEKGKHSLAEFRLRHSPFKKLHAMRSCAEFADTMSTLLAAGIPITRALQITSAVIGNTVFGENILRVMEGVEEGRGLAECMREEKDIPAMLTEMTGVGETSGSLEDTLGVIGDYYNNEVQVLSGRLLTLLEPVMTLLLAFMTVILLLAVYLPMFGMLDGM